MILFSKFEFICSIFLETKMIALNESNFKNYLYLTPLALIKLNFEISLRSIIQLICLMYY